MKKLLIAKLVVAALLLVATPAHADEASVRVAIGRAVPAGLGVVVVEVPARLARARGAVRVRWDRAAAAGWSSVRVSVGSRSAWVRVQLGAIRPVLRAARALRAGDVVAAGDLAPGESATPGLDVAPEALFGAAVVAPLAVGDVVTTDAIELPPPLRRGAEVAVVVRRGTLEVTTRGKLEGAARVGEDVAVRVAATKSILRGRLVDRATVEIRSEGEAP